jgi:hypothetical protein
VLPPCEKDVTLPSGSVVVVVPPRSGSLRDTPPEALTLGNSVRALLDKRFARLAEPGHRLGHVEVRRLRPLHEAGEHRIVEPGPPLAQILAGPSGPRGPTRHRARRARRRRADDSPGPPRRRRAAARAPGSRRAGVWPWPSRWFRRRFSSSRIIVAIVSHRRDYVRHWSGTVTEFAACASGVALGDREAPHQRGARSDERQSVYPVPAEWRARLPESTRRVMKSSMVARLADPGSFLARDRAKRLDWIKRPELAGDWSFDEAGFPHQLVRRRQAQRRRQLHRPAPRQARQRRSRSSGSPTNRARRRAASPIASSMPKSAASQTC